MDELTVVINEYESADEVGRSKIIVNGTEMILWSMNWENGKLTRTYRNYEIAKLKHDNEILRATLQEQNIELDRLRAQ